MNIGRGELVSTVKVGSLFDGIGGTPLSAVRAGAEPVWASEIEKWPISITKRHFPNMKHLGDITQINGAEIEPVDIIVGGSPCQDLSVAGKREGLDGERSGLFMDQIRIVKEMRNATRKQAGNGSAKLPRPRYMVWENVPGAFSSNKGEDFRVVLEEIARISEPGATIPKPEKRRKSGVILGDSYSIAWRTVDAQYWGVPQRRRRIYLVADFGGSSAPEICFERESVSGDSQAGGETWQRVAGDTEGGTGSSGGIAVVQSLYENHPTDSRVTGPHNVCPTVTRRWGTGGNNVPLVRTYATQSYSAVKESEQGASLKALGGTYGGGSENYVLQHAVRRLTPLECERLQGYPDGWTALDHEDKAVSDTQRYKALGNSFAVPNAYFFISRCVQVLNGQDPNGNRGRK